MPSNNLSNSPRELDPGEMTSGGRRNVSRRGSENNCNSNPRPSTACFPCRNARQKCDRKLPCSRCNSHEIQCHYPAKSNRGRKPGSVNKPTSVQKLLAKISDPSLREQLTAIIVAQRKDKQKPANQQQTAPILTSQMPDGDALEQLAIAGVNDDSYILEDLTPTSETAAPGGFGFEQDISPSGRDNSADSHGYRSPVPDAVESDYSPLQILAAAVGAEQCLANQEQGARDVARVVPRPQFYGSTSWTFNGGGFQKNRATLLADSKLARYFASRDVDYRDWDVMSKVVPDSLFHLEPDMCDPVAAGLVTEQEVLEYFKLFFEIRNPVVGALDPELHTPEYVHGCSFTLFSVICALGCELSSRSRDRLLAPLIYNIAERNVKWSILNDVKTVETVQAIIVLTYWAHVCDNQADDPSWLRFGHALSIARELKIYQPSYILKKVDNFTSSNMETCDRQIRNFQRTWLFVFIMDKSFGTTLGRAPCVSWKEVPSGIYDWSQTPTSTKSDFVTAGIIEMRILLLRGLEKLARLDKTPPNVDAWNSEVSSELEDLRTEYSSPGKALPSRTTFLPILLFYIDHGILLVHTNAYKECSQLDVTPDLLDRTSRCVFSIACRLLRLYIHDPLLASLALGSHNTQLIMVSHAATEMARALNSAAISGELKLQGTALIRSLAEHISKVANRLPGASWSSLYLEYVHFLVRHSGEEPPIQTDGSYYQNTPRPQENALVGHSEETFMPSIGNWDLDVELLSSQDLSLRSLMGWPNNN